MDLRANQVVNLGQAIDGFIATITKGEHDKYTRASSALYNKLQTNWKQSYEAALAGALKVLRDYPTPDLTPAGIDAVVAALETSLGVPLAASVTEDLLKVGDLTYKAAAKDIIGAEFSFQLADQAAINFLGNNNTYWIGTYYNKQLSADVAQVGIAALEAGMTKRTAGQLFQHVFRQTFDKRTAAYWRGFATNVVTQAREFGHTGAYEASGAEFYEIMAIIDKLTSEICLRMHGTRFPVQRAVDLRDAIMGMETPEEIKEVNKWYKIEEIENVPDNQLPGAMSLPPYHFKCRTRSVLVVER